MRIEPVRRKPDLSEIECRAENGAGDPVYVQATLTVYDGKHFLSLKYGKKKLLHSSFLSMAGEVGWVDTPNGPYGAPKCENSLSTSVYLLDGLHVKLQGVQ